ncbi:GTP pyrophosphokinase family protein [Conexibacter sp. CPCC 206217]|uniref:GTP pyrophosphokinase n=1 Tax=Conexibacter sp. CPCC 206217 TaxID=3064574 RepID=UPI00272381CE|nr:RelA/SpoT domain-containing protein [Conexibacter sp. CPCC 206217]MDO8213966.1 RelA/SpoT domain-containing protein [Conexibacter sp. CPCC 206217]
MDANAARPPAEEPASTAASTSSRCTRRQALVADAPLPAGTRPAPRRDFQGSWRAADHCGVIDCTVHGEDARRAYERDEYQTYLEKVRERTQALVLEAVRKTYSPQQASVTARVKAPGSFETKAAKSRVGDPHEPKYMRPLSAIHDQVAVRVVVLHSGFLSHARDLIQAHPELIVEEREDKAIAHWANRSFGYHGIHLSIRPVGVSIPPPAESMLGCLDRVEIQVRTHAQHAWAEVEHGLRYKSEVDDDTSRMLDRVAALLETADGLLETIDVRASAAEDRTSAEPAAVATLPEVLERHFPGGRQPRPASLRWITRCARTLGLDDPAAIDAALQHVPFDHIEAVFSRAGHSPRSQLRQLDDALLWIGREDYVHAAEAGVEGTSDRYARGRVGILRWRLSRLLEADAAAA